MSAWTVAKLLAFALSLSRTSAGGGIVDYEHAVYSRSPIVVVKKGEKRPGFDSFPLFLTPGGTLLDLQGNYCDLSNRDIVRAISGSEAGKNAIVIYIEKGSKGEVASGLTLLKTIGLLYKSVMCANGRIVTICVVRPN
jgi:hypothetical protein